MPLHRYLYPLRAGVLFTRSRCISLCTARKLSCPATQRNPIHDNEAPKHLNFRHDGSVLPSLGAGQLPKEALKLVETTNTQSDHILYEFPEGTNSAAAPEIVEQNSDFGIWETASATENLEQSYELFGESAPQSLQYVTDRGVDHVDFLPDATPLVNYLQEKDDLGREMYVAQMRSRMWPDSLPDVVLHYFHTASISESRWTDADRSFRATATKYLESKGLSLDNITTWAWILTADGPESMINRLFSSAGPKPIFLFLTITYSDVTKAKSVEMLLRHVWRDIFDPAIVQHNLCEGSQADDSYLYCPGNLETAEMGFKEHTQIKAPEEHAYHAEEDPLIRVIGRLLYYARSLWPAALASISKMLVEYMRLISNSHIARPDQEARRHKRVSDIFNLGLHLFALPATANPFKSMIYNWEAQKILLEVASDFTPALLLDQRSYWAVMQVLLASRKSLLETKSANLRTRTWPPWRREQDGMDAQRPPEDDVSRVLLALARAKESGYAGTALDDAIRIYGGQDVDGTPTIQTRAILNIRSRFMPDESAPNDLHPYVWSARIEATRDTQEAWSAFTEYRRLGGCPHLSVYLAMFKKLNSEEAGWEYPPGLTPGDGREVLSPSDDNYSEFYRSRLQPPSSQELYKQLLDEGLRPHGRCLSFLVGKIARTPAQGLLFLRDSGLKLPVLSFLIGGEDSKRSATILEKIPDRVFAQFIRLICRFAPRAGAKQLHYRLELPLQHATFLLKARQFRSRPAWYYLFAALSRRIVPIVRGQDVAGLNYDRKTWQMMISALGDFHSLGMELDPYGFQLLCQNYERYAMSAIKFSEGGHLEVAVEASRLLKGQFRRLTQSSERSHGLPKLLYSMSGSILHMYVRCMGHIQDHEEIITCLKFMVGNEEELEKIADQAKNGMDLVRRTMVAIRIFCTGTECEEEAKVLMDQLVNWGGWPTDEEVQSYKDLFEILRKRDKRRRR